MDSVLARATAEDVELEPFPLIVLRGAVDDELCAELIESYPPVDIVAGKSRWGSTERFSFNAAESPREPTLAPAWREFVEVHTSQRFNDEAIALFGDAIRKEYPDFEERFGALESLRAGTRRVHTHEEVDLLVDGQICVNTPVTRPSSVRTGHLDLFEKLFAGLFYLRHPDDRSTGGELEIYRFKPDPYAFHGKYIDHRYLEVAKRVEYEKDVLVFFLNTPRSLHGVTVRSQTELPRLFFNIVTEVRAPLFDLDDCQEGVALRAARRSAKILGRLAR